MSDIGKIVKAIQGNSVKREILDTEEDGYVLTWDATNNEWKSNKLPSITEINGVNISGIPSVGQVLTATNTTNATWQTPAGGSVFTIVDGYYYACANGNQNILWNTDYTGNNYILSNPSFNYTSANSITSTGFDFTNIFSVGDYIADETMAENNWLTPMQLLQVVSVTSTVLTFSPSMTSPPSFPTSQGGGFIKVTGNSFLDSANANLFQNNIASIILKLPTPVNGTTIDILSKLNTSIVYNSLQNNFIPNSNEHIYMQNINSPIQELYYTSMDGITSYITLTNGSSSVSFTNSGGPNNNLPIYFGTNFNDLYCFMFGSNGINSFLNRPFSGTTGNYIMYSNQLVNYFKSIISDGTNWYIQT